jgi:hypothetical protein
LSTDEKTAKIGFRGTEDYRERLQRAALDRHVKVQQLIEDALAAYLSDKQELRETARSGTRVAPARRRAHDTLDRILDKAGPAETAKIMGMIELCERSVGVDPHHGAARKNG